MKRRNREVNIFSVSLLDILCGALGAFCFFTIVLMPYYKPQSADAKDLQEKQNQMQQEVDALRRELANSPDAQRLLERLRDLERRIQETQGELNRKTQELQQVEQENRRLRVRNPVVVTMRWEAEVDADLYVRGVPLSGEVRAEPLDANKTQFYSVPGDMQIFVERGPAREVFLARDSPTSWVYEVYYKYRGPGGGPLNVTGNYLNEGKMLPLPSVTLNGPGSAVMVGKIRPRDGKVALFEPASAFAQSYRRELAEWLKGNPSMTLE